jgi:hypothetical protein
MKPIFVGHLDDLHITYVLVIFYFHFEGFLFYFFNLRNNVKKVW